MLNVLFAHGAHTVLVGLVMPKPTGHVLLHKACPGVVTAPGSQRSHGSQKCIQLVPVTQMRWWVSWAYMADKSITSRH